MFIAKLLDFVISEDIYILILFSMPCDHIYLIYIYTVHCICVCLSVECSIGTYYNVSTRRCDFCPRGSYQTATSQTSCISCASDETTEMHGAVSISECIRTLPILRL